MNKDTVVLNVNNNNRRHSEALPLVETHTSPPLAKSEIDDLDDDRQIMTKPHAGVDDGFFNNIPDIEVDHIPDFSSRAGEDGVDGKHPGNGSAFPGSPNPSNFPHDRRTELDFPHFPDLAESIPDVNVYQHKKTLAQGMMDLALFSANANQLRYVLESSSQHPYYYPSLVMITMSLVLQVAIGVGLIWNSRYNVKDEKEICIANKINNYTVIGIFIVTSVNVFISAFGVANMPTPPTPNP